MIGVQHLYVNAYINIKISYYIMMNIEDLCIKVFTEIGKNGPIILFIITLYLLKQKYNLFFYYTIGIFINTIVNLILKGIIQEPRPGDYSNMLNLAIKNNKNSIFRNGIPFDMFGMPSGHAQSVMFSVVYIYLSTHNKNYLFLYLFIATITIIQRIVYNYHTVLQVFVGSIVGSIIGYYFNYIAIKKIEGFITPKKHDNALIY